VLEEEKATIEIDDLYRHNHSKYANDKYLNSHANAHYRTLLTLAV